MLARCEENIHFTLRRIRRNTLRELDQIIGHARHGGNGGDDAAIVPLRVDEPLRDGADALGSADRSATIFLNNEAHVYIRFNEVRLAETTARFFADVPSLSNSLSQTEGA